MKLVSCGLLLSFLFSLNIEVVAEPEPSCLVKTRTYQLFAQRYMDNVSRTTLLNEIDKNVVESPGKKLTLAILDQVYVDKPSNFITYGKEKFAECESKKGKSFPEHALNSCFMNLYIMDMVYRLKDAGFNQQKINEFLSKKLGASYLLYESVARKVQTNAFKMTVTETEYVEKQFQSCLERSNTRIIGGTVKQVLSGDTILIMSDEKKENEIHLYGIRAPKKGEPSFDEARRELERLVLDKKIEITAYIDSEGVTRGSLNLQGKDIALSMIKANLAQHEPNDFEGVADIRSDTYALATLLGKPKKYK